MCATLSPFTESFQSCLSGREACAVRRPLWESGRSQKEILDLVDEMGGAVISEISVSLIDDVKDKKVPSLVPLSPSPAQYFKCFF